MDTVTVGLCVFLLGKELVHCNKGSCVFSASLAAAGETLVPTTPGALFKCHLYLNFWAALATGQRRVSLSTSCSRPLPGEAKLAVSWV